METCGEDCPHLITQVYTTLSTVTDDAAVEPIHQGLEEKSLLPVGAFHGYWLCDGRTSC
ncbi:transposase, IS4 family, putative [Nostoc sp. NIES-3756]|jgi:hypothetical protein|uniref:hypothetical protein n=1 Tax=Nostoc sp. NIES-3756 TaxID=1751286 RepID=UPI0007216B89|nr:hypothetical protein [Nostoc sp. NIES-3756]BAT53791.1 transposase, IS4 family, putative [Nostoc sp. NIES-3756]BAY38472.1 putative transposase, IS4 family [Nostoc sp. NIES-2111]